MLGFEPGWALALFSGRLSTGLLADRSACTCGSFIRSASTLAVCARPSLVSAPGAAGASRGWIIVTMGGGYTDPIMYALTPKSATTRPLRTGELPGGEGGDDDDDDDEGVGLRGLPG